MFEFIPDDPVIIAIVLILLSLVFFRTCCFGGRSSSFAREWTVGSGTDLRSPRNGRGSGRR